MRITVEEHMIKHAQIESSRRVRQTMLSSKSQLPTMNPCKRLQSLALRERMRNDGILLSDATVGQDRRQAQSGSTDQGQADQGTRSNGSSRLSQATAPAAPGSVTTDNPLYRNQSQPAGRVDLFA